MATKAERGKGRPVQKRGPDARLTIQLPQAMLESLAAWARVDGRTTSALVRHLIEEALAAHGARLAMTRR
jgi:hypothetical protein